jgi:hypothetical protein
MSKLVSPFYTVGALHVVLKGQDGEIKTERKVENLVVTAGHNHIADRLAASPSQATMQAMAIGTGTTAPAIGNTQLGNEIDRNAFTVGPTATNNSVAYRGFWDAGDATNTQISEAGIFNNTSSGGTMLCRATFTAINKGTQDTLQIDWTITLTNA